MLSGAAAVAPGGSRASVETRATRAPKRPKKLDDAAPAPKKRARVSIDGAPPARDPPGATAAAPGSIMATAQFQLSATLLSKKQILELMPNGQGSHVPAVYAAGGTIYALCFSEDANPGLPTVVEISCGTQRKKQVQQFEQLKQRGGTVPLFVCLKTARGRLELLPSGSGSKGFRFAGMRSVVSVQTHSRPKMVGGEARQATVTLSAPTAGGTCPLQVAGIPRAIQVVGAPVTPEDEPEFIETRGSKKRARPASTLRDSQEEEQAKALKEVKKEKIDAENARDIAQGERDIAQDTLEPMTLTVNALQTQVDDALALALAHGADPAAVDAIRNRPRV